LVDKVVVVSERLSNGSEIRIVTYGEAGSLFMTEVKKPSSERFELFSMSPDKRKAELLFEHFLDVASVFDDMTEFV
jgi:hypothetical protein